MLLIQYNGVDQCFDLLRRNPATKETEHKQVHESEITFLIPDDGAINAVLALAKQVPNQFHVVPNKQVQRREAWGRMVL